MQENTPEQQKLIDEVGHDFRDLPPKPEPKQRRRHRDMLPEDGKRVTLEHAKPFMVETFWRCVRMGLILFCLAGMLGMLALGLSLAWFLMRHAWSVFA